MKKFIQVFLSLASMSVIAGCACQNPYGKDSDDPQVLAIREDINNYMEDYGRSIEKSPCTYSSDNAKAVFEKIQVYQQQNELKNLSYEMVSQDKKTKITFIGDHLGCMKAVYEKQGKIVRAVIVNGKRVFESKDGSVFEEIPVSSPVYREFQFIYAKNMKVVKSVKVAKLDEWLVSKRVSDTETIQVLEAKERYLDDDEDNERVIYFETVMKGTSFSVPVDMAFTTDPQTPMPKKWYVYQGPEKSEDNMTKYTFKNFMPINNDDGDEVFTYASVEIVNDGKDVILFQIDKVLINQELPPQTFVPEKLLVIKPVQAEVKKPEVKKADPKKAEVKKPEVKK